MRFKKIIKLFEEGNVAVCGLRGRGKDLLMSNVVARRKLQYISNIDYGGLHNEFNYVKLNVGNNDYTNFINGNIKPYSFPYQDGTDIYLSDAGIYFPSQFCNDLNRNFKQMAVFQALSRHLGSCNFHFNVQNLNRVWDKIREQSDTYILCNKCIYIKRFNIVLQKVTIYDNYESAQCRREQLKLPRVHKKEQKIQARITEANFIAQYGHIKSGWILYKNKSTYDTRRFKTLLEETTL